MRIIAAAIVFAMLPIACASRRGAAPGPETAQADGLLAADDGGVTQSLFDLGVCFPRVIEVRGRPARESIIGVAVAARPGISECLVDPKNRGSDKNTKVNVDITVGESTIENRVSGENLNSAGQACIKGVLDGSHAFDAAERDGGTATSHVEFNHLANVNPTVNFGLSESSDIAGEIRLAEKSWCDCFEPWKSSAPQTLKSRLHISKDKSGKTVARIEFERTRDGSVETIQRCLASKIEALNLPLKSEELRVPHTFLFIHSGFDRELADASPTLNYWQLRALRNQRAATTALKLADRVTAIQAFENLAAQYKPKREPSLVPKLKDRCNAAVAADTAWTQAIEQQLETDKRTLIVAKQLKTADPNSPDLDTLQRQITASQTDLETAKKTATADAGACTKNGD